MTRRPGMSPGPTWAVLSEPATSSQSTRTSIRSDVDVDLDVDMSDDEADPEPQHHTPIPKRKVPTDEAGSSRRPQKQPRLDLNRNPGRVPSSSSVSPSISRDVGHASRMQPAPPPSAQKQPRKPISPERLRVSREESTSSGTSTNSEFPSMLSQVVQKAIARGKEKEKEKTRPRPAAMLRRGPPATARKQTGEARNIRKVTTANLLKEAQKQSDSIDESRAWTRIKPRGKQKRTTYDQEMANVRPLAVARQRDPNIIELTDSSDSTRRRRPSQSTINGSRPSVSANKDDTIIIIDSSEDDRIPATRPTQRRKSGAGGTQGKAPNRKKLPPPVDAEVISISDSDEDVEAIAAASRPPAMPNTSPSTSRANLPSSSQNAPAAPPPPPQLVAAPTPVTAPTPNTAASTSRQLSDQPPSRSRDTPQQDNEPPFQPPSPPSFSPPDDFEDTFGNMDFDTTRDDVIPSGGLDGWDSLNVGPSLPAVIVSGSMVSGVNATTSVPNGAEEEGSDSLFNSFVNMDQLGADMDQGADDDVSPGGADEAEQGAAVNGVTSGLEGPTPRPDPPPTSRNEDSPDADGDRDGDVDMQDLEDGEMDPNEVPPPSTRFPETPESGEIRSQEARKESQPPSQHAARSTPVSTLRQKSPSMSLSPRSSSSGKSTSQLVMPDLSSYKGVRFKRPSKARDNPFFSRALNGAARPGKGREEASARGRLSTPVEAPSPAEVQDQGEDTDMQDDTAVSVPEPSRALDEAVGSMPSPAPQQPDEVIVPHTQGTSEIPPVPMPPPAPQQPDEEVMGPDTQDTSQTRPSTVQPSTNANDPGLPASTQPATPSIQATQFQPPPPSQPPVRSSSRPIIPPPRVPRPNTPKTLTQAISEMVREKQEREIREGRDVDRRLSHGNLTAEHATPSKSPSQGPKEPLAPTPSQPLTPMASSSQSTRPLGRTPSLNGLRMLLAKRNSDAGASSRPTSTGPPTRTSTGDGESSTPVAAPAELTPVPTVMDEDGHASAERASVPVNAPAPVPELTQVLTWDGQTRSEQAIAPSPAPEWTDVDGHVPVEPELVPVPEPELTRADDDAPADLVAMPPPAIAQVPRSTTKDRPSPPTSEGMRIPKSVASTPTPTTASISGSNASSSTQARRRRAVPFEAFTSPVYARNHHEQDKSNNKGKNKEVAHDDPFVSPSANANGWWSGSQQPKGRALERARRESTSEMFEAFIVRESPKQTSDSRAGTHTDSGRGSNDAKSVEPASFPQPPEQPELSASPVAPVVTTPAPVPVPVPASDDGEDEEVQDGSTDNVYAMEVDKQRDEGDVGVDAPSPDDGVVSESEVETSQDDEMDETDTLLGLASVHLSQEAPADEAEAADHDSEMDLVDESGGSLEVGVTEMGQAGEPEREVGNVMAVDLPCVDLDTGSDEEISASRTAALQTEPKEPSLHAEDVVTSLSENNNVADTSEVVPEEGIVPDDGIAILSDSTTPDLVLPDVLPEDDGVFPSTSNGDLYDPNHARHHSGGADSIEECDELLKISAENGYESGSEVVFTLSELLKKSGMVPSTSLASARSGSPSPQSNSRQRSPPRAGSSPDSLDLLRRDVSDQGQERTSSSRSVPEPEYLCGHRVITWASQVAEQRRQPPEYKRGKDLPHSIQDYMNTCPTSFRDSSVARHIFEAHIEAETINESTAPSIEIFDNDIGDEVTPQWEFHYSNDMWYGEGVPPPDIENLEGCGCIGKCDPKSGKCACARRQLEWVKRYIDGDIIPPTWPGSPFVYDSKGMLQRLECPIFECNRFCRCDDDCPNRVVQNGRKWPVHIVKTEHKGWGVSAGNKKIPKGSYLGIYAGEFLTEQEGEERGRYYDLYGRTYLFSIDFHHLRFNMDDPDEWENLYVVDAYHAGNFTRFLNHSCDPNCKIFACYIDDADVNKPLLAVFTTRDVEPWEELCFSYYGDIDEKREEIEQKKAEGEELVREHAVYAQCRCEAANCIGRLFG